MKSIPSKRFAPLLVMVLFGAIFHQRSEAAKPNWEQPINNNHTMTVVAQVTDGSGTYLTNTNDILAAFIGDNVAGVASPSNYKDGLTVYLISISNSDAGNVSVRYKFYDAVTDRVLDLQPEGTFIEGSTIGRDKPLQLAAPSPSPVPELAAAPAPPAPVVSSGGGGSVSKKKSSSKTAAKSPAKKSTKKKSTKKK
jgi:hypothetical protein